MKSWNKGCALLTALLVTAMTVLPGASVQAEDSTPAGTQGGSESVSADEGTSYRAYRDRLPQGVGSGEDIVITPDMMTGGENATVETVDGKQAVSTTENSWVEYTFTVPASGIYVLEVEYNNIPGKYGSIERNMTIDGENPFDETANVVFPRVWEDAEEYNNGFSVDQSGNEIRPSQNEKQAWRTVALYDTDGYTDEPFRFYLEAGEHTLRLQSISEPMAVGNLTFTAPTELPSYEEWFRQQTADGVQVIDTVEEPIIRQAENTFEKSDRTLYPSFDRSNPATEPYDPDHILLNTVGGDRWKYPGQWISWQIEVPETGLYRLVLRERQNLVSGQFVTRRLYVNGEVPYQEANQLRFIYNGNWQMWVLGDGDNTEYYIYLEAGKANIITLEATLGAFSEIVSEIEDSVQQLNYVYRQILMITGADPDPYRDYELDRELPECMTMLTEESARLTRCIEEIQALTGSNGYYTSTLERLVVRIDDMAENPARIPNKFTDYKDRLVAVGSWILSAKEQPLELDYIMVTGANNELPKANKNIFVNLWSQIRVLAASFVNDYSMMSGSESANGQIDVWMASRAQASTAIQVGRDQATTLSRLTAGQFTPQYGIGVNVKLVADGSLLPALLAGKGPDVYVSANATEPINYALRNAVMPLNDFEGFDEVVSRFYESALTGYTFEGKVYAIPETQTFPVLFYRTDILEELGITKLDTWDDIRVAITELQKRNMEFGMPSSQTTNNMSVSTIYYTLLYQRGGTVYNENQDAVALDSDIGVDAFKQWTNYFTGYRLPVSYDFATRFRMGEIPMGIADYTVYNMLSVFAPEIEGMWGFTLVPGTVDEEGNINRSVAGTGVATIMMATTDNPDAAWTFMKWWSEADTQIEYGQEIESVLGVSARYPAANKEAIASLPWNYESLQVLEEQRQYVQGVPEIPGSYLTERELTFAFREVVLFSGNPRESLTDHMNNVNLEITKKRNEFGLETGKE